MTDIFISCKTEDESRVKPIVKMLEDVGYNVWWACQIPPGQLFRKAIAAVLREARCVIVVWSSQSISSPWVLDEADVAIGRNVLLPVLIDDVILPMGHRQLEAARLIDWNGDASHAEWRNLIAAVESLVGPTPKVSLTHRPVTSSVAGSDEPAPAGVSSLGQAATAASKLQASGSLGIARRPGRVLRRLMPALIVLAVAGVGLVARVLDREHDGRDTAERSTAAMKPEIGQTRVGFQELANDTEIGAGHRPTAPANQDSGETRTPPNPASPAVPPQEHPAPELVTPAGSPAPSPAKASKASGSKPVRKPATKQNPTDDAATRDTSASRSNRDPAASWYSDANPDPAASWYSDQDMEAIEEDARAKAARRGQTE